MAELVAAIAEAFVALIMAVIRVIPAVIEVLAYLLMGAVVAVGYGVSKSYRARKEREWAEKRWLKFWQLGGGSLCLAALVAGGVYAVWVMRFRKFESGVAKVEHSAGAEDLRVRLDHDSNSVTIAVKEGGLSNIFATRTMRELTDALRQNVRTVKSAGETNSEISR